MLKPRIGIAGPSVDDRASWEAFSRMNGARKILAVAERLAHTIEPAIPDELYLEFSKTGNRTRYQHAIQNRRRRLCVFALAECMENKGRFLGALRENIRVTCAEKSWLLPAHDRGLHNFNGDRIEIDLASSAVSWNLAIVNRWLGKKLAPTTRRLIAKEIRRRTFDPFLEMVRTGKNRAWWLYTTNNWNAVCLANVVGAALTAVDSRRERAEFLSAADYYATYYLKGFTPDGYCSEGLAYWNYGFGHYLMLAEIVKRATGGKLDLLDRKGIVAIARYPINIEILPGVYPAFADCPPTVRPSVRYMAFLRARFGFETVGRADRPVLRAYPLGETVAFAFTDSPPGRRAASGRRPGRPLRSWFADAGVLICRPAGKAGLGVAIKGGHNGEHHNHNDVGTFVVATDGKALLVDPGAEVYTARTFSRRRYESQLINSYGHPVPVVAGRLQKTGRSARAVVVRSEFTDGADTITLDMRRAYDAPELEKLERTFAYCREAGTSLTVTDEVRFSRPSEFATALVTFSKWRRTGDDSFLVYEQGGQKVRVRIDTNGADFQLFAEKIREDLPDGNFPTRLGIRLKNPVKGVIVKLKITPEK